MKAAVRAGLSAGAGVEVEARDGQIILTVSQLVRGQGGAPDSITTTSTTFDTEGAAVFADVVVSMACIAEEQAYHRGLGALHAAMGVPIAPRDLAVWARDAADADAAGAGIPAFMAGAH